MKLRNQLWVLLVSTAGFTLSCADEKSSGPDPVLQGSVDDDVDPGLFTTWQSQNFPLIDGATATQSASRQLVYELTGPTLTLSSLCRFQDDSVIGPVTLSVPVAVTSETIHVLQSNAKKETDVHGLRSCATAIGEGEYVYTLTENTLVLTSSSDVIQLTRQ